MSSAVRVRIDLAYDGAGYAGFARQPDQRTVQGVLEDALSRLVGAPSPTITCAGRTDAGVHAIAQVVHLDVPGDARLLDDLEIARRALDKLCGVAITIWRVRRVPATFDARFSAVQRRYRYRLCDAEAMAPLLRHDTCHLGEPTLDTEAMEAAGRHLIGEHDFSSFCRRPPDPQAQMIRRLDRIALQRAPAGLVTVAVDGKSFCHQMVRSVVGTLVAVGRGRRPPDWVAEVLAARNRQVAGPVAPPHGLTLVGVRYG